MTPTNDRRSVERYTAFVVMVVVITAGFLLMAGLLRLADRRAAQAGDIIAFPATRVPSVSTAPFAARRAIVADSMTCVLDVQTMQKSGGSLVVEASRFDPGRIFRVHWVGVRTSSDRDDCGSSADLLLNSNQISALIFAAGGTGVACTLLAALWAIGDFVTPDMVSSGAPDGSTDVLATVGVDYLLDSGKPALGIAATMCALPLLIPLAVGLMRTLGTREVQL